MVSSLLTISILLSMLFPIINWALSSLFTQIKLPRTLFVLMEVLLIVATLLAIIATLLDYHLILNRQEYEPILNTPPTIFGPYLACLAIIQMFYVRQQYRISFIFTTNLVTLGLALPVLYFLPPLLYTMPIVLYYGVHTFVLTVSEIFYWDYKISGFIRKQVWITKIDLLESMLPKKNINAYILSSTASFCYSSLNVCVLLSYKTIGISEYIALGFTCILLIFSGSITFALLVKYDDAGNTAFPGSLLIHYIIQAYKRCENLISGNVDLNPKFTFRTLFFAIIVVINGLGSTAFGAAIAPEISDEQPSSPVGEGQHVSRGAHAARQMMSWTASEMAQGASEIPRNTTSSIGALGTGAVGAGLYSAVTNYLESGQEEATSEQELVALQEKLAQKDRRIAELEKALENQKNNSFFNRLLRCFKQ